MTRWGVQELESYQLVEYARQVPCYVCGGGNRFDTEFCRHCRAPLALSRQADGRKTSPQLVAVIGATGVGKTVYLGMLTDILSRQHKALTILARGAFSVSLQQQAMTALSEGRFPPGTPNEPEGWNWVHCEVAGLPRRRSIELVLPDVSGEAFLREVEHPHSVPAIRSFLAKCSAVILLIDAEQLESGRQEQDFLAMKIVTFLLELPTGTKHGWQRRPLALIFSKGDRSPTCCEDPAGFARTHTPGLQRLCAERVGCHKFFGAAVAGACVRVNYFGESVALPLRIEPRGVVEPFAWLVEQLPAK